MMSEDKYYEPIDEEPDRKENTLEGWTKIILGGKEPSSKPLICKRCGKEEANPITKLCEKCDKKLHPNTEKETQKELKVHKTISKLVRK